MADSQPNDAAGAEPGPREGPCSLRGRLFVEAATVIGPLWLRHRRSRYRPTARAFSDHEAAQLAPFFGRDVLGSVRIATVHRIADPVVFRALRRLRLADPSSLETMAGMAIIDTVVVSTGHRLARGDFTALLFHELVHVLQYRILGVRGMVRRYIRGWVGCGYDYWSIPLEEDAYELTGRFTAAPGSPFDAHAEVLRRLGKSRA